MLNSALFGSAEIAFNVFETFRGVAAAQLYARVLATVRESSRPRVHDLSLSVGDGNDEALDSGAWWFYQKLGFRPRAPKVVALMQRELERQRRDPEPLDPRHPGTPGERESLPASRAGETRRHRRGAAPGGGRGRHRAALAALRRRGGAGAARGGDERCAAEARSRLGIRSLAGWNPDERAAFHHWGPIVLLLPGVERWSAAERAALGEVIRAKGGRRESEFVRRFDAHPRLPQALAKLARSSESL